MKSIITVVSILIFFSCQKNQISGEQKEGLICFQVRKSLVTHETENNRLPEMGSLWSGLNNINAKSNKDTLLVEVNTFLYRNFKYEGGYEFLNDTLFLYAESIEKEITMDTVFSTVAYKILTRGHSYKTIEFKELK